MNLDPRLVRAVVTAAVATLPETVRYQLASEMETIRFAAEDALVERIMQALAECRTDGGDRAGLPSQT